MTDAEIWGDVTPTAGQQKFIESVKWLRSVPEVGDKSPSTLILAGYAGTGKTTSIKAVARMCGAPVVITPTGKAALRVTEATGLAASTIHRWLYWPVDKDGKVTFQLRPPDMIDIPKNKLVVVDEASMLGRDLWKDIYKVCRANALKLILVGDGFQLPPVAGKNEEPFSVMTWRFPVDAPSTRRVELTEIMRQAADSPVIKAATALREGRGTRSFEALARVKRDDAASTILATLDAQGVVICHKNETRHKINLGVRQQRNLPPEPQIGEPLMVLRNNYTIDIVNGEQIQFNGWEVPPEKFPATDSKSKLARELHFGITRVNGFKAVMCPEQFADQTLVAPFDVEKAAGAWAWKRRHFNSEGKTAPFVHVNWGYAYTAHKSQGSEWPYAFVVLEPSVRLTTDDGARWAYTSITRAAKDAAIYFGGI